MKKAVPLLSIALLLFSCGKSINVPDEASITKEEGERKWSLIADKDALSANFGNKCLEVSITTDFTDITLALDSSFSLSISANGSQQTLYDTVDDVCYQKSDFFMSIETNVDGYRQIADGDTLSETWSFSGNSATKSVIVSDGESVTDYSIAKKSTTAKEDAANLLSSYIPSLDDYTWESLEYFGNEKEYDLRVSGSNGEDASGNVIEKFDITFIDGLPTNYSLSQTTILQGQKTPVTASATFSYPSSLDIATPDLSSEEWANATILG